MVFSFFITLNCRFTEALIRVTLKFLDRFLRDWRIRKAIPYIKTNAAVLDIGCLDGHLFEKLSQKPIGQSLGLDPLLKDKITTDNYTLIPGMFPEN